MLKKLLQKKKDVRKKLINFISGFLKKKEKQVKWLVYTWLVILNIIFLIILIKDLNLLKIVIYLLWLTITIFIVSTMKDIAVAISETNDNKFIIYAIFLFWLNISCAFFFVWSNIIRPIIRYYIVSWKLYEILPWKIDVITVDKLIIYGFAIEYWEFIFILLMFYYKIYSDMVNYDEETNQVDEYKEFKGTFIYKYKFWIDLFRQLRLIIVCLASVSRIVLLHNPYYINDILFVLVFLVIVSGVILWAIEKRVKKRKINEKSSW